MAARASAPERHPGFTRLAGMGAAKQAGLLLAVEPKLGGLLLIGGRGSGKSALLEGLVDLAAWSRSSVTASSVTAGAPRAAPPASAPRGEPLTAILAHHWDLLSPEQRAACHDRPLVLAGVDQPLASNDDRLGLQVHLASTSGAEERQAALEAASSSADEAFEREELAELGADLDEARRLLPRVSIGPDELRALISTAQALLVEGNRADYLALLAARAAAALDGRTAVEQSDLEVAVRLVLAPRAREWPLPDQADEGDLAIEHVPTPDDPKAASKSSETPASVGGAGQDGSPGEGANERNEPGDASTDSADSRCQAVQSSGTSSAPGNVAPAEVLIQAARAALAPELLARSHSTGVPARRGRAARPEPARGRKGSVALTPTLRAALPWQRLRGRRPGQPPRITKEDLRLRRFVRRPSALHLVVLDSSASMAANRMAEAKGMVESMLRHAYVRRERVALVAFRGQEAALLLAPGRGLACARGALDSLRTGGGTPLASGLSLAVKVAGLARSRCPEERQRLVLLTDGHARVTADRPPWPAIRRRLAELAVETEVIDTGQPFMGLGQARELAAYLGASYKVLQSAPARRR